jgi:cobalt-precorrin-6B (C15)-methyltransferase
MTHYPGVDDSQFIRGAIPMTKQEIRTMVLCKAKIAPDDIVIDIGAGTGSLSIEAGLVAPQGQIYAIERAAEGVELIKKNAAKFGVNNITVICQEAPAALVDLPQANAIFVGGSGGQLPAILAECDRLLFGGGRLIITAVTVETLMHSLEIVQQGTYQIDCFQMQISRLKKVGASHMFQALNPIFIIACTKQA